VLHHLRALAPGPRHTILLPGYQAPGTRGADLAAGARILKIHGRQVPVRARVRQLDVFSAHADREDLIAWATSAPRLPERVFVVHGAPVASDALRRSLAAVLPAEPGVPESGDAVELS
jgi:metallo-beta-lactamase family protein